ncbi:MAG: hypothetical protein H0T17_08215 [Propionibacteriales bacterium]|nr:hypothetical protein [Propionibacteriales bacterium]
MDSATTASLTYVGLRESGFNSDGFFLLRGKGGVTAKARLPFEDVGHNPEIVCERAMPAVPHLLTIINLTALSKGVLPLHASAFTVGGTGILVTGWAKGGKTESLLGCMTHDGQYIGDEWIYLTPDGQMLGVPEPIRLWAWHLEQLPDLLKSRPARERRGLSAWKLISSLAKTSSNARLPGAGLWRKASPILDRQAYLQIPPEELFGPGAVALQGRLDVVVLVVSHESAETIAEAVGRSEVSGRMAASLADERAAFMDHYRQFQYAFPGLASAAVDSAGEVESHLLSAVLDDHPAAKVLHPHPCDISVLGQTVLTAAKDAIAASIGEDEHRDGRPKKRGSIS